MEQLATYFAEFLGYNLATSFIAFAIIYFSRRNKRELTLLRGLAVLLSGWLIGSRLVFVVHFLFALGGTEVQGGPLEGPVSMLMIILAMYAIFSWLSTRKSGITM